jgi:methyltransferase (TIGR00027 family)
MVANVRAYHHDNAVVKIFDDPVAGRLLLPDERAAYAANSRTRFERDFSPEETTAFMPYSTEAALIRARYNEEKLIASLSHGVAQYVIVGAGFDSFGWRRPDLKDQLQVFEIDHPVTQTFKMERLQAAGLVIPTNLHFGAADFEHETVADVLKRVPYDVKQAAFFSWLGVTCYLTHEAIMGTFRSIKSMARPGSEIVFDYILASALIPENLAAASRSLGVATSYWGTISHGLRP